MVITHHGGQCFKVVFGDLTIVFDPIAKGGTLPAVRFGADIALVSRNHKDMNGIEEVAYGERKPFAIEGPGEYEYAGVTVQGFLSSSQYGLAAGEKSAPNTIYAVHLEGMTLVHLGALSDKEISKGVLESLDGIDVLFVGVGGEGVLDASRAYALAVSLEPHVIIPMHWKGMGAPDALEKFLKEEGGTAEKTDKLTLKKKDVLDKNSAIIVVTA